MKRILLIDDSNSVAMVVSNMISEEGMHCSRAKDGLDAIEIIKNSEAFDLILLDWNMPNMDGLEFLQYNQEHKIVDCPIVMMTTENKPEKIMKALEHGAVEYIMKPFTQDILISKIITVSEK